MAENTTQDFIRTPDFAEQYSNNIRFESSAWDLKMIFGVLDQSQTPLIIRQFGALNISWAQAKILAYFLQLNILFHETQNGMIRIPGGVLPPPIDEQLLESIGGEGGAASEIVAKIRKLRADLNG